MNIAAQALLLPDPGKYFILAMRHGSVELASCINPDIVDDDAALRAIACGLRNAVKIQLAQAKAAKVST